MKSSLGAQRYSWGPQRGPQGSKMRLGEGFGEALGRLWEALGGVGKALGSLCKALGGSGKALGGSRESAGAERNDAPLYIKKN